MTACLFSGTVSWLVGRGTSAWTFHTSRRPLVHRLFSSSDSTTESRYQLLKERLCFRGPVDRGYGRGGKKLGFPTANLPSSLFQNALADVEKGVYFGWAVIEGTDEEGRNVAHKAVVNVGLSPTFEGAENPEKIIEAHLSVGEQTDDEEKARKKAAKKAKKEKESRGEEREFNTNIMLTANFELFSGFESQNQRRIQNSVFAKYQNNLKGKILFSISEMETFFRRLKTVERRVDLEEHNVERSRTYYEGVKKEYLRGYKNSADLASASDRYTESIKRKIQFMFEFLIQKLKLERSLGAKVDVEIIE